MSHSETITTRRRKQKSKKHLEAIANQAKRLKKASAKAAGGSARKKEPA